MRASLVIDGEQLASETFTMPAAGGVRVLLVAGGADAGVAPPSGALPAGHPALGATPDRYRRHPACARQRFERTAAIAGLLGLLAVASAVLINGGTGSYFLNHSALSTGARYAEVASRPW